MMQKSLLDKSEKLFAKALNKAEKLGAESAKIAFSHGESLSIGFEAGRLKEADSRENLSYSINVLIDNRIGRVAGNRLSELDTMVEQAVRLTKVGSQAHFGVWPGLGEIIPVKTHCRSVTELTRDTLIQTCETITDRLKKLDSELFICCSGGKVESEYMLMTSSGICHTSRQTNWSLSGFTQRTQNTDMLFVGSQRSWGSLNPFFTPEKICDKIITDLRRAEQFAASPKGSVKTLLSPAILSMFLRSCIYSGINGRNVAKGDSPLQDRLDEQILDPAFTIVDDPHVDFSSGATEIDADGIPTRKQTLFAKGVLKKYLYDLDTAALVGVEPTGNSGCSPYFCTIQPGMISHEEMIAELDDGIYIKQLLGFGQSNIINGDFSANVALGFRIQNGKITGRIKDCMISGNIYDILKSRVVLSSDTNYSGQTPYAQVEGISISTK